MLTLPYSCGFQTLQNVPARACGSASGRNGFGGNSSRCSRVVSQHWQESSAAELTHIGCSTAKSRRLHACYALHKLHGGADKHDSSALATTTSSCTTTTTTSSSSSSTCRVPSQCGSTRRQLLLQSTLAPFLVQLVLGSDDATTIVNSVLSAYGLPTLKAAAGFRVYDEFEDEFYFEYPKAWVARPNSMRKGVVISDYQTADKLSVEELDLPEDGDIAAAAVAAAVLPGGRRLVQDDVLSLPAARLVKTRTETIDGQELLYLEFPSETLTRSGYNIRRKNFAAAAVRRGKLYTIAASARSDQFNEQKKQLLQHIVQSFRLR